MSLFKESIQDHLTPGPIDTLARASYLGMAHFAGTGPHGSTCRECVFWNHTAYNYRAKNGKHRGIIKPARCRKYTAITSQPGAEVPDDAAACKYFEQNETVPDRFAKS